jgi:hypothetical protein
MTGYGSFSPLAYGIGLVLGISPLRVETCPEPVEWMTGSKARFCRLSQGLDGIDLFRFEEENDVFVLEGVEAAGQGGEADDYSR